MAQEIAYVKRRIESILNSSFKTIDSEIEDMELDPVLSLSLMPQQVYIIWVLSKLGQTDFFGLRMLLKRIKQSKTQHEQLLNFFNEVQAAERQAKYDKLIGLVNGEQAKSLLKEHLSLYERIPPIIQKFVIQQIASFYTCLKLSDLANILGLSVQQTAQLVHLSGYHEQDGWVKFPQFSSTSQNLKQMIKNKQYELTQLSTLLSSSLK